MHDCIIAQVHAYNSTLVLILKLACPDWWSHSIYVALKCVPGKLCHWQHESEY